MNINFDEGYKSYTINGDENRVIRFRVDPNLVKRLADSLDEIKTWDKGNMNDPNALFDLGNRFCDVIDKAFDSKICKTVFGNSSPFTVVSSGKTLYESFFDAFMPVIKEEIQKSAVPAEPRGEVKKYIEESPKNPEMQENSEFSKAEMKKLRMMLSQI